MVELSLTGGCTRNSRASSQRLMLAGLLILSLVLGNAYTGQLLGFLAAPPRYPDPLTLEEVAGVVRKVYIHGGLTGMFRDPEAGRGVQALKDKLEIKSMSERLDLLPTLAARREDGAFMSDHRHILCSRMKDLTEDGEVLLHMVPECVYHPGQSGFIVRKNSAFYYVFNRFVLRATEAGLYKHWMHAQSSRVTARGMRLPDAWVGDQTAHPLPLPMLSGPFAALGVGLAAAVAAFVVELVMGRRRRKDFRGRRKAMKSRWDLTFTRGKI